MRDNCNKTPTKKNHKKIFLWCSEKKMCIINISYKRHFFPNITLIFREEKPTLQNVHNRHYSNLSLVLGNLQINKISTVHQKYMFVLDFEKNHFTSCTCWLSFMFYLVHFQHRVFKITKVIKDKLTKCWMMKSLKSFPDWNRRHHRFIGHQIIIQILIKNSEKKMLLKTDVFSLFYPLPTRADHSNF